MKNIEKKPERTVMIGDVSVKANGVLGVRQVTETEVEIKYVGPSVRVKGTSSEVLRKLRGALLRPERTDSA